MRKMKYVIGFLILFMIIGFATVTVSLSINGNAKVVSDIDDFKVYFSDVLLNGEQDLSLVKSSTELQFDISFTSPGVEQVISYDVTNASKMFDASLTISCTQGDEYLSVVNEFDTSSNLSALSTRSGTLTLKKTKSSANETDLDYSISCEIEASPVERATEGVGEVVAPLELITISTGDVISIEGENFNVISQTEDSVTMLAQYNLGTNYRQTTSEAYTTFSDKTGWEYTPGPKEIDIQTWGGNAKTLLNGYVDYLSDEYGVNVSGDLITMSQLSELGCTIPTDYAWGSGGWTCENSLYSDWLVNGQYMWTRSTISEYSYGVWVLRNDGLLYLGSYTYDNGVRPVITIPLSLAQKYYVGYEIGRVISIADEKFNVISDNGDTVTMLAQYNLSSSYLQSSTSNDKAFSSSTGWEYAPGPKEIDIQIWSTHPKTYINNYVAYLQGEMGISNITGDLITLRQLGDLGCEISSDYSYDTQATYSCENSLHIDWLDNGQTWWSKSAVSVVSNSSIYVPGNRIWVFNGGYLVTIEYSDAGDTVTIRPVVTIPKELYS